MSNNSSVNENAQIGHALAITYFILYAITRYFFLVAHYLWRHRQDWRSWGRIEWGETLLYTVFIVVLAFGIRMAFNGEMFMITLTAILIPVFTGASALLILSEEDQH